VTAGEYGCLRFGTTASQERAGTISAAVGHRIAADVPPSALSSAPVGQGVPA